MDVAALGALDPSALRTVLPGFLAGYLTDPDAAERNRARIEALVGTWSDDAIATALAGLRSIGEEHRIYPAHPLCREVSRAWTRDLVVGWDLVGAEHLVEAANAGPVLLLCNHLSYVDSTVVDAVLTWAGHTSLADRIVSAAGPKVYEDLFRRFASSCLNTLPVPQSNTLGHTAAVSPRDLARRAIASLSAWRTAATDGAILLLYPEGARTRTGRMGSFLKGASRFLEVEGLRVVPAALDGTQHLMPLGVDRLRPGRVQLAFGPALEARDAPDPRVRLARAHEAVARLLPQALRPDPEAPRVV